MNHKTVKQRIQKQIVDNPHFLFIQKLYRDFPHSEVYLVGGAVRDMFLGRETKDFDFVVRNVPLVRLQKFLQLHGSVNLVGKKFGVLKFEPRVSGDVLSKHKLPSSKRLKKTSLRSNESSFEHIDIALPRTEFSIGNTGQYRDFAIQSNPALPIEEDLSRRDFTINALAWDMKKNICIDPFDGQTDLQKKIIRTVGKPSIRFSEDYSRIVRAVRFACSLHFSIEEKTRSAIAKYAKKLNDEIVSEAPAKKKIDSNTLRVVPYEIIAKEMVKSFFADPVRAFDLYDEFGLFRALVPEVLAMKGCPHDPRWHSEGDVWTHTRLALSRLSSASFRREFPEESMSPLLVFATLFHDIGKPQTIQIPGKDPVDRIRYLGHDRVGADSARGIVERLRLASVEGMSIDSDIIHWLIKNHLLILNTNIETIRNNTIERYFYSDYIRGRLLLQLMFADGSASLQKNMRPGLHAYRKFKKKLGVFNARNVHDKAMPASLLDGDEIMALCALKPSARVGEIKYALREEQLAGRIPTKKSATQWVKQQRI